MTSMTSGKIRWADSSSDEENDIKASIRATGFQQATRNDSMVGKSKPFVIPNVGQSSKFTTSANTNSSMTTLRMVPNLVGKNRYEDNQEDDAEDEDEFSSEDEHDDDESFEGDSNERLEALRKAREAAVTKKTTVDDKKVAQLSKKERLALKAKELDELDSILNEFGISSNKENDTSDPTLPAADTTLLDATHTVKAADLETLAASTAKKKKKKMKEVTVMEQDQAENNLGDYGQAEILAGSKADNSDVYETSNNLEKEEGIVSTNLDVASVLKAKATIKKTKEKSSSGIAAATAAKEAKAKKEATAALAAKKQKKEKKDKYAYGAPR